MNNIFIQLDLDWPRLRRWTQRGGLAVLDQGLFSGANFLVNILLARWLSPEEYGAFAVVMSIYYLLMGFHTAVLTEPMMVFGAGKYREQFRKYLGMVIYGHWAISALIALLLGGAALVMARLGSPAMAQALAGLAIASPFLLLLWLTRRVPYVEMQPQWAVVGSGVNFLLTLAGAFLLWRLGLLSNLSGLVLLGAASSVASLALLLHAKPQVAGFVGNPTPGVVLADHWSYGGWNVLSTAAYWASGQLLMLLVPIFLGLEANAAVAAIWNLYRPLTLFFQSLELVLLPTLSRWIDEGTHASEIKSRVVLFALIVGCIVGLYNLVLMLNSKSILYLLYAGKYLEHIALVWIFGIGNTTSAVLEVWVIFYKAKGKIRSVSFSNVVSALLTLLLLPLLVRMWKLEGAVLSIWVAYWASRSLLIWYGKLSER